MIHVSGDESGADRTPVSTLGRVRPVVVLMSAVLIAVLVGLVAVVALLNVKGVAGGPRGAAPPDPASGGLIGDFWPFGGTGGSSPGSSPIPSNTPAPAVAATSAGPGVALPPVRGSGSPVGTVAVPTRTSG